MSCFLPKGILSTSASDGGLLAEVQRQAALEASTAVAGPDTAGEATGTAVVPSNTAVARDASQLWSVEPVIDFKFERANLNSPHAQTGTAPAPLSQQQRLDSNPPGDPRANPGLSPIPSRSAPLPQRAPPPPTRDQSRVSIGSTASPVGLRAKPDAASLESIVSQHTSSSESPMAPVPSSSPVGGAHTCLASPGSQHSPSSSVTQEPFPYAQDYVRNAPDPSSSPNSYPYPAAEFSSPIKSSSAALSRQSLQQSSFSASTAASSTDSSLLALFRSTCVLYHQPQPHVLNHDKGAPANAAEAQTPSTTSAQVITLMEPQAEAEFSRALGNAPTEGSGGQPDQALPSQPPAPSSSLQSAGPRQTDSLEYIHSWLDTNPEGKWSPFPFSHQSSPVKSQSEGLERQMPAQQVPTTPEGKSPAQRALQFSPMSVTQPGAEVMHAHLGKLFRTAAVMILLL